MSKKQSRRNSNTKEEVLQWIKDYQETGDEEAQTNLVLNYELLVHSLARKYSHGRPYHEDLVQVGMLGLLGAIRRYDPEYGRSFEAFAVPTIIGEIKRFMRDKTWAIHVPRRIKELGPKIRKTAEELTVELQRSPRIDEIAEVLEVDEEDVLETIEMGQSYQALSMDHTLTTDADSGSVTLFDLVGAVDKNYEETDERMILAKALGELTERERKIIELTYIEEISQKKAGEQLGISQMHVSRLQRKAIKKLREIIFSNAGGVK